MESFSNLNTLLRLAQTPAGQQLVALIQQQGGERLSEALTKASAGDYRQAQELLSQLLVNPEAQNLIRALEESK